MKKTTSLVPIDFPCAFPLVLCVRSEIRLSFTWPLLIVQRISRSELRRARRPPRRSDSIPMRVPSRSCTRSAKAPPGFALCLLKKRGRGPKRRGSSDAIRPIIISLTLPMDPPVHPSNPWLIATVVATDTKHHALMLTRWFLPPREHAQRKLARQGTPIIQSSVVVCLLLLRVIGDVSVGIGMGKRGT
jgi:hypothetical protein